MFDFQAFHKLQKKLYEMFRAVYDLWPIREARADEIWDYHSMRLSQWEVLIFPMPHCSTKPVDKDHRLPLANIKIGHMMIIDPDSLKGNPLDQLNPRREWHRRGASQQRKTPDDDKEEDCGPQT
jgi:hypothetical protein